MTTRPKDTIPSEDWHDVIGFEGIYQVSSLGLVKSLPRLIERSNGRIYNQRGRILKGGLSNGRTVSLHCDGEQLTIRVSRLVWEAFIGEVPAGKWVLHRDGNERNCAVKNLVLGDSTVAERMKVERNGGVHPLAGKQRITDAFWASDASGKKGYVVT